MHPLVVHCKKDKFDVYIGRPSKFGNLFVIGKNGSREEVIAKYKTWLVEQVALGHFTLDDFKQLKGKRLGCWCAPQRCHGEVIMAVVDELTKSGKI